MNTFQDVLKGDVDAALRFNQDDASIQAMPVWMFKNGAIRVKPKQMWRMNMHGKRYYYTFLDLENYTNPVFYVSVTSSVASMDNIGKNEALLQWYGNHPSYEAAVEELRKAADYGSFFHALIAAFLRDQSLTLDDIRDAVDTYTVWNNIEYSTAHWFKKATKDLLNIIHWMKDHEVEPIIIEAPLASKEGFATAVDLVCNMSVGTGVNGKITKTDIKKGTIKRVTAIVDWKTGKSFYLNHGIQLEACRRLVEENYPDIKIEKLINVSAKGERGTAAMKDWTDKMSEMHYLPWAKEGYSTLFDLYWAVYTFNNPNFRTPPDRTKRQGVFALDDNHSFGEYKIPAYEWVVEQHQKQEATWNS